MTFKEKLMQEHPEKDIARTIDRHCPDFYGYEKENYLCDELTCDECWNREIPEERNDNMENLKEKMGVTTFVQTRDGEFGMLFLNPHSKDDKGIYSPQKGGCFTYLCDYESDLTYKKDSMQDIMKIKFPSDSGGNYSIVKDFFESEGKPGIPSYFKWDWERKEEPVTKDISLEELNEILKEKYPDIDKFNLPIKE